MHKSTSESGTLREILIYAQACAMQLLPRGHASHRHSAVDWSKPADQWPPELRSVRAYDVVQRPGDVLYLPQSRAASRTACLTASRRHGFVSLQVPHALHHKPRSEPTM